jgi:hypothetical protein
MMYFNKISLVLTLLSVTTFGVTDAKKKKKNQCTIDDSLTKAQTALAKNLLAEIKTIGTTLGSKYNRGPMMIPDYAKITMMDMDMDGRQLSDEGSCGFLDLSCYVCKLCQCIVPKLEELGSDAACDAGCILTAEVAGGGPEDPVADAVGVGCVPLCSAIFDTAVGATALAQCQDAKLC